MIKEKNLQLKNELIKLTELYSTDKKIKTYIEEEFISRNLLGMTGTNLLMGNKSISTLSDENNYDLLVLFIFTFAMYNALKKEDKDGYEKINVENYFTKVEIEEWTLYKTEKKEVSRYPYTLKNMLQVAPNHWVGIISSSELNDMYIGNDVLYNFSNQRDPRINVLGMKEINLDKNKVNEITNNLVDDIQFPDEIKINVLKNGEDEIAFSSKNGIYGDLIIKSGTMNIFDGYHRFVSNSLAMLKNPNLNFTWKLAITNMSETKARSFMVQINKQKPIRQEHVENMNPNKAENIAVDFIIDIPMNDFSDMVTESDDQIKRGIGLTKKSILANAIKECFNKELEIKSNIKPIANHISEVVNYIIGLNYDNFIKTKNPIMTCKNIFIGYVALAKNVYELDNWKDEVKKVLNSIDFSESNSIWTDMGLLASKDASKTLRDKLYKIFSL